MNTYVLIHIGKCGGNTVNPILKKKYKIIHKHIKTVKYNPIRKYIILIRNPISRFISAFNWRFNNVCVNKTQELRFKGERDILNKYKTVNKLAEDIYRLNGTLKIDLSSKDNYIHHIYEDINFYIGDFLDKCNIENIYGVITTETIEADLKRLFNIEKEDIPHNLKNKKYDTTLSVLGYNNLKKYLDKDYKCIEKMYKMNIITEEQYNILSK